MSLHLKHKRDYSKFITDVCFATTQWNGIKALLFWYIECRKYAQGTAQIVSDTESHYNMVWYNIYHKITYLFVTETVAPWLDYQHRELWMYIMSALHMIVL